MKRYYSGRGKRDTIKSQIVDERFRGLILEVSSERYGSIHDLKVFEGSGVEGKFAGFKERIWTDKGYLGIDDLGIEDVVKGWGIEQTKRKPKERELSEVERERNKEINRGKVKVENKILEILVGEIVVGLRVAGRQ